MDETEKGEGRWYPEYPRVGVGMVVIRDGRMLMVRRAKEPSKGKWSIPGGAIELGETLHEAVVRETLEECSVKIGVERLLDTAETIIRDDSGQVKYHFVMIDFLGRHVSGEIKAQSDAGECRWVALKEIDGMDIPSTLRAMLKRHGII